MQLTQAQIENEVRFWVLDQDREHQLFYKLGFQDGALKSEAGRIHEAYEDARRRDDLGDALRILQRSQAFKQLALAEARARWVGFIYPLFLEHTFGELEIMRLRTQPGGIDPRAELCAVNQFNADHMKLAAHLLDPSERTNIMAAGRAGMPSAIAANRCAIEQYDTLLALSKRAAADVDGFFSRFDPKQVESIIHPVLAAHVVREGKRFLANVEALPQAV